MKCRALRNRQAWQSPNYPTVSQDPVTVTTGNAVYFKRTADAAETELKPAALSASERSSLSESSTQAELHLDYILYPRLLQQVEEVCTITN